MPFKASFCFSVAAPSSELLSELRPESGDASAVAIVRFRKKQRNAGACHDTVREGKEEDLKKIQRKEEKRGTQQVI